MSAPRYNSRSPAVKRLMREAAELHQPTYNYFAQPVEDNLFEWHFTIRGPADTPFAKGIYHGRISLPADYPMKPPNIFFLTPNGRFETNTKICLSISGFHPESWRPSWSIRTALLAMIGFMPTHGNGAIGSLDYTEKEREILAERSLNYVCEQCGRTADLLLPEDETESEVKSEIDKYAKEVAISRPAPSANNNEKGDAPDEPAEPRGEDETVEAVEEIQSATLDEPVTDEGQETAAEDQTVEEVAVTPVVVPVNRNKDDLASFLLMWLLVFVIGFILYRRLRKHYDFDLVTYFYSLSS